jgi:hypothetical protein
VCIDGSVNESIMNHNGAQKYVLIQKQLFNNMIQYHILITCLILISIHNKYNLGNKKYVLHKCKWHFKSRILCCTVLFMLPCYVYALHAAVATHGTVILQQQFPGIHSKCLPLLITMSHYGSLCSSEVSKMSPFSDTYTEQVLIKHSKYKDCVLLLK